MIRPGRDDDPDRLYTVTGGRSRAASKDFDLVTLVVSECDPVPGMQSEHAAILRMCRYPTAVVEIAAELGLPVSIVKILLSDLLDSGRITARHPQTTGAAARGRPGQPVAAQLPDPTILEQVLVGLRNL
ncbi:DUF742 domain-containing protein [Streptomyces aidingensis]|uniref:DUF742 domain-containing protein n=1 Tax=Streptomyces aidingensis TaxID=910347 RepID=A0A1I1HDA6_9ACTN|nr:DUF742 domain-containing protein [Streptomyces aidingensis]SFC21786.1 Protein of unknown function [Streptomyces aidingensis]